MILPPDSKNAAGPQSSSSDTAESSSRATTPTPRPAGTYYPDRPLPYSQAYRSPHGMSETSPLLEQEYHGPAPPYSPTDPTSSSSSGLGDIQAKTSAISRTRRRFWMALPCAFLIYVAVLLVADLIVDLIPPIDYHPGDPSRHRPGRGGGGSPDEQERHDGDAIDCLSFPGNKWKEYSKGKGDKLYMSQKKPVYVNSASIDENFLHLAGEGSVARVIVDTYQSWSAYAAAGSTPPPASLPPSEGEAVVFGDHLEDELEDDELDAMYAARGMIRIVVEPIIHVFDLQGSPSLENSPGLEMLAESKICVMQHDAPPSPPSNVSVATPPRHKHRSARRIEEEKPLTSQGLGVYTHRPKRYESDHNRYNDALSFNIYISLPEEYPPTFMELLLIAMGYEIPRGYVRSFEIRGDVADISINAAQQRTGRLLINTAVGNVDFKKFVAEYVKVINEAGSISGNIDVSSMLDLSTETGGIDVTVGLAPVATEGLIWTPPGVDPVKVRSGKGCELPAIVVNAHTSAGTIKLGYNKWSQACRGLKQNFKSEVGTIQVHGHPMYEGPYRLTNSVGSITAEKDETARDPNQGMRRRVWTMNRSGGWGSSCTWGDISWSDARGPSGWDGLLESEAAGTRWATCPKDGIEPGSDGYDPMTSSLNAESEVGAIHVVL